MASGSNSNIPGPQVEHIEDENLQEEHIDGNLPEELSPDSTLIIGPGSSSPIIPVTPSTPRTYSGTPSPSLLEVYEELIPIPASPTVPIDEHRSSPIASRTRGRLALAASREIQLALEIGPVSSRTRSASNRRLEANQNEGRAGTSVHIPSSYT